MNSAHIVALFRLMADGLDEREQELVSLAVSVFDTFEEVEADNRILGRDLRECHEKILALEGQISNQASLLSYYENKPVKEDTASDGDLIAVIDRIREIVQAPEACALNDIVCRVSLLKKIYDSQPGEDLVSPVESE